MAEFCGKRPFQGKIKIAGTGFAKGKARASKNLPLKSRTCEAKKAFKIKDLAPRSVPGRRPIVKRAYIEFFYAAIKYLN